MVDTRAEKARKDAASSSPPAAPNSTPVNTNPAGPVGSSGADLSASQVPDTQQRKTPPKPGKTPTPSGPRTSPRKRKSPHTPADVDQSGPQASNEDPVEGSGAAATDGRGSAHGSPRAAGGKMSTSRKTTRRGQPPKDVYERFGLTQEACAMTDLAINDFIEIKDIAGKGRAIVTKQANIPAGTLLLQEDALIQDLKPMAANNQQERTRYTRDILDAVNSHKLVDVSKRFLQLTFAGLFDDEASRVKRNAFIISKAENVWYYMSLVNHSCIPNAYVTQFSQEMGYNLRTLVDIPTAGTEVTINYSCDWYSVNEKSSKTTKREFTEREMRAPSARRAYIDASWGFRCTCPACTDEEQTKNDMALLLATRNKLNFRTSNRGGRFTTSVLDVENEEHRNLVDEWLVAYVELLRKYHLFETILEISGHAVEWFSKIDTDLARGQELHWRLEQIQAGRILHGTETLGPSNPFKGSAENGKSAKSVNNLKHIKDLASRVEATTFSGVANAPEPRENPGRRRNRAERASNRQSRFE